MDPMWNRKQKKSMEQEGKRRLLMLSAMFAVLFLWYFDLIPNVIEVGAAKLWRHIW